MTLPTMGWAPRNRELLARLIDEIPRAGGAPFAVFDWDQTSAFLDVGEALLRHQLFHLELKLSPDELRALLPDAFGRVVALAGERKVALADIHEDVVADYRVLHERRARAPIAEVRALPEFLDFVSKLHFLYEAYGETPGIGTEHSYVFILQMLAGFTLDEVRALAARTIRDQLAFALEGVVWRGPDSLRTRVGPVETSFRTGLRVHGEMQALFSCLGAAGIEPFIVTASLKQVVEVFAGPLFGYGLAPERVIGMELDRGADGRLLPRLPEGFVQTQFAGKVAAIRRVLGERGEPILVGGDGDSDAEMLSAFKGTRLSLILNRVRGGRIGALSRLAVEQQDERAPRYLLQGRDENTGLFRPDSATIPFGEREPRPLADIGERSRKR